MFRRHLQHLRNKNYVIKEEEGEIVKKGKQPKPDDLLYGEIAINYGKGYETLFIKNSENEVIPFPNFNDLEKNKLKWEEF